MASDGCYEKRMADKQVENSKACCARLEQGVKKRPFDKMTLDQASGNLRVGLL